MYVRVFIDIYIKGIIDTYVKVIHQNGTLACMHLHQIMYLIHSNPLQFTHIDIYVCVYIDVYVIGILRSFDMVLWRAYIHTILCI